MQCKYLASGTCPVLSCDNILVAFLGSGAMSVRYFFDGVVGSRFFMCSCLTADLHATSLESLVAVKFCSVMICHCQRPEV